MEPNKDVNEKPTEEVGSPWEETWGSAPVSLEQAAPEATQAIKAVTGPWEKSWGSLVSSVQAPRGVSGASVGDRFNTVFNRLVGAESRGVHRNADGSLLSSPVGAQGITQVMPKTGKDPGYGVKPLQNDSEEEYLRMGKDYLQAMLSEYNGDYEKAVAAYNAGPGSVDKAVSKSRITGKDWKDHLPKKSETLPYLKKILS